MKSFTHYLTLNIPSKTAFRNITPEVKEALAKSGVREGIVLVNTTATALRPRPHRPAGRGSGRRTAWRRSEHRRPA